jgi:hypothetical protein
MAKELSGYLIPIVAVVITVLFCVTLIPDVGNNISGVINQRVVANETINLSPARISTGINESYVFTVRGSPPSQNMTNSAECKNTSAIVMTNQSGTVLTDTTDYIYDSGAGTLTFVNTAAVRQVNKTNTTLANYVFCPTGYAADNSGARGIFPIVLIFACVAIALVALYPAISEYIPEMFGK